MKIKGIIIGVGLILLVVAGFFLLTSGVIPVNQNYQLNDEIKNFPIQKTSVTFTEWSTSKKLYGLYGLSYATARSGNIFVVINYTVHNSADTELDLVDFYWAKIPMLKYGDYYADAYHNFWNYEGSTMYLMPNQTLNGFICYEILEGYEPIELLFPNKDSPKVIIELS